MIKPISAGMLVCLTALSFNTQADVEPGIFIGFDLSTSLSGTFKVEAESSSGLKREDEVDTDSNTLGIYLGYRFPSNNRFQISRNSIDVTVEGSDEDDEFTGTDFDWQFVYGEETVQPYWGLGFGLYNLEDSAEYTKDNEDIKGISFQLMGGLKLDLHEHFEIDVSYRAKSIGWQDVQITDGFSSVTLSMVNTSGSLNFGAAVKF